MGRIIVVLYVIRFKLLSCVLQAPWCSRLREISCVVSGAGWCICSRQT